MSAFSFAQDASSKKVAPKNELKTPKPTSQEIDQLFQEIIHLQGFKVHKEMYNSPISAAEIAKIEELLGEPLPGEFKQLYAFANGQNWPDKGLFFQDEFLKADEIIRTLEMSRGFIKPENKVIEYPEKSQKLVQEIVDFYFEQLVAKKQKSWFKVEFICGVGVFGGVHLFADKDTPANEYELINLEDYMPIATSIEELHLLERKGYNWDQLKFTLYIDGKYEIERLYYNLEDPNYISSTPENAIKKKYFHYKWLPIFGDSGGNFIGIDLDPDAKGKKGQVINFGHDEDQMVVLADDLKAFFDFILVELKKRNSRLKKPEIHIHNLLKKIKLGQK